MLHKRLQLGAILFLGLGLTGLKAQTVKDIEGNVYRTVTISNRVWMAENLRVTKYNDGRAITLASDNKAWKSLTASGYCWYDNDKATYGKTFGALYNGYVVESGNICPTGWHVPSDKEWDELQSTFGFYAGTQLKEKGAQAWKNNSSSVTNESGFSATGGGYRHSEGGFTFIKETGLWWTSVKTNQTNLATRAMYGNNASLAKGSHSRNYGASIRCIKD